MYISNPWYCMSVDEMNLNQPILLGFCDSCDNISLRISMKINKMQRKEQASYKQENQLQKVRKLATFLNSFSKQ